jgi:hypothetical protein
MKTFLKVIYVLLTVFLTAITTANLTAMLYEYGTGWDGIAGVLGGLMIGALLGLVGGIYSLRWIKDEKLGASILVVIGLTLLMFLFIYLRVDVRKVKSMRLERTMDYPSYIGLYKVSFERDLVLDFQSVNYTNGELTATVFDSLVINENATDFSYAPPWFVPYYSKPDYQVLEFEVKSLHRSYAEVVVNKYDGKTAFLSLESGTFVDWHTHLLLGHAVDLKRDTIALFERPLEHASAIKSLVDDDFKILSIKGEWAQVWIENENRPQPRKAWCKWYDAAGEVVFRVNYFM